MHRKTRCVAAALLIEGAYVHMPDAVSRVATLCGLQVSEGADAPEKQSARLVALEAIAQRLAAGHDVRLMCWCAPARCHGHDIARVARVRAVAILRERAPKRSR